MLLIVWRVVQVALFGAIVGYVVAGHGAAALGLLLAFVVGTLWELERRLSHQEAARRSRRSAPSR